MNSTLSIFQRPTIVIDTPAKANLWRKVLIAKITVQVILLGGLLALAGWDWKMLLGVGLLATVWQVAENKIKRRRANNAA